MTIKEMYDYYGNNWAKMARELGFGTNTVFIWKKKGTVPIKAQMIIEKRTNGLFKASLEHAEV